MKKTLSPQKRSSPEQKSNLSFYDDNMKISRKKFKYSPNVIRSSDNSSPINKEIAEIINNPDLFNLFKEKLKSTENKEFFVNLVIKLIEIARRERYRQKIF